MRVCSLTSETATRAHPMYSTISGPPDYDDEDEKVEEEVEEEMDDAEGKVDAVVRFQKKWTSAQDAKKSSVWHWTPAAVGLVGVFLAGLAIRFGRGRYPRFST